VVAAFAAWGWCGVVGADEMEAAQPGDARIWQVDYAANAIYRLQGVPGYAIDLQFAAGERFEGLGGGDLEAVTVSSHGSHLFLKPKAARVATNLTLLTNQRVYHVEYRVEGMRARAEPLYALVFRYPNEIAASEAQHTQSQWIEAALAAPARVENRAYGYCGPAALKPSAVTDDGVQTRIRFPARADLPAVFVRNEDGTEALANFTVQADGLIVHRVAHEWVLRHGRLVGCIVNLAYSGTTALSGGTVSPEVVRGEAGGSR
jgi:type IV secretion system protein VirB9